MSGMKGLDDHIMGTHIHYKEMVNHVCPKCGAEKEVLMEYELGQWDYPNDEGYCASCDCEMEIKE